MHLNLTFLYFLFNFFLCVLVWFLLYNSFCFLFGDPPPPRTNYCFLIILPCVSKNIQNCSLCEQHYRYFLGILQLCLALREIIFLFNCFHCFKHFWGLEVRSAEHTVHIWGKEWWILNVSDVSTHILLYECHIVCKKGNYC